MSSQAQNNQSSHNKDTKLVLQEMQDARKTTQNIKAQLIEQNDLVKLHTNEPSSSETENDNIPRTIPVLAPVVSSDTANRQLQYNTQKSPLQEMEETFVLMQKNYIEALTQWMELPFQFSSHLFKEWENLGNKQNLLGNKAD